MFQCFGIGVAPVEYYSVRTSGKDRSDSLGLDLEDAYPDEREGEDEGERLRILLEVRGLRGSLMAAARRRIHDFLILWKQRRDARDATFQPTRGQAAHIVMGDIDADKDTELSELSEGGNEDLDRM